MPSIVLTSIFPPNAVMREIAAQCGERDWDFIIAGDSKSPADFEIEGATFLSLADQRAMSHLGAICPERSYARKNLAYLEAIRRGADCIIETDDDNMPLPAFWKPPACEVQGRQIDTPGWVNAYQFFSDTFIYPRGFPINLALPHWQAGSEGRRQRSEVGDQQSDFSVSDFDPFKEGSVSESGSLRSAQLFSFSVSPIQQSLADDNPDVDAVYRMLHPLPFQFRQADPLILGKGSWCPFNSQNTVFFPEVYPLLYLPATCSFRMTDIWRGFIAQRILWTCDWHLSFHSATVTQERNEHDLLKDFEDEISGYLGNQKIVSLLDSLDLKSGPENLRANLETCYAAMIREGFFQPVEETQLTAWMEEIC